MKKILKLTLATIMAISLFGCSGETKETLKVFNWGEYIDTSVIKQFEEEFNCKVIYETFDSNESMYVKLQGGNQYDVMFPSEYMIEKLIIEDLIQPINMDNIPNMAQIDEGLLNQSFDTENQYWVPYFCGNVGIIYDTTIVDEADFEDEWNILRNTKYSGDIYMYDSVRDSFVPALKSLGYSMNTTDEVEIAEAAKWLDDQRNEMDPVYVGDEVIDAMVRGEKAMAVMYSGDAAAVMAENEDMSFYMPSNQGTNYWFDGMVLSKDSQNVDLATSFMNFMISYDIALANTSEVGYYSTNVEAAKTAGNSDYNGIEAYTIRYGENDECFEYQTQDVIELYNLYWEKIITQ